MLPNSAFSLQPAPGWALFLDVDGTILHLRDTPDGVHASEELLNLLEAISDRLGAAVALVSGRSIDNLDALFAPHRLPTAGLHGLERRDATGTVHKVPESEELDTLRPPLLKLAGSSTKVILEDKGHALAVHYRLAPDMADQIKEQVEELARPFSVQLHVMHGKMVSEIKPRQADKGSAIRDFMAEHPFEGRIPVFIGDDTTDEDGFACVNEHNGYSVRVGESETTAARHLLCSVDDVIDWLSGWPDILDKARIK
ncbi:MAG TPA: trehalose-phosphatase [Burkholderiales bacterium]|nr:trehalose-phosphatase [Burkholderiales bacterium]